MTQHAAKAAQLVMYLVARGANSTRDQLQNRNSVASRTSVDVLGTEQPHVLMRKPVAILIWNCINASLA